MANAAYNTFLTGLIDGTYDYGVGGSSFGVAIHKNSAGDFDATDANMTSLTAGDMPDFGGGTGDGTATLTNAFTAPGTFDSSTNPTITPTANPATCRVLVIYYSDATDVPLLWFDTGAGLSSTAGSGGTTTEGGSMQIVWSSSGIFTLS